MFVRRRALEIVCHHPIGLSTLHRRLSQDEAMYFRDSPLPDALPCDMDAEKGNT
jgi:hypothetical protein